MNLSPRELLIGVLGMVLGAGSMLLSGCGTSQPVTGRDAAINSYVKAVLAYNAGHTDKAIADLQQAVKQQADLAIPHELLADLYSSRKEYTEALTQYEISTRLDPYSYKNHYNLGLMEQLLGRVKEAVDAYLRALKLQPTDFMTNQNLGAAYLQLDDYDNAIVYCKAATEFEPASGPAWSNLAAAYEGKGDWKQAEAGWRIVLELKDAPKDTPIWLAKNLEHQRRFEEARAVFSEVVHTNDTAANRTLLGDAYYGEQKDEQALEEFANALKLDPNYSLALNETGRVLITEYEKSLRLDEPKRTGALEAWKKSLSIDPNQQQIRNLVKTYADKISEPGKK